MVAGARRWQGRPRSSSSSSSGKKTGSGKVRPGPRTKHGDDDFERGSSVASAAAGQRMSFTDVMSAASDQELSVSLVGSNLHVFTVGELKAATQGFLDANFLGEGGFGPVYKGSVDDKAKPGLKAQSIAVKLWDPEGTQGHKEWLSEVIFLGQFRHTNLVKLVGYCCEEDHRLLVYEYMAKGSLENHLFKKFPPVLSWSTRLNIAVGAAKASPSFTTRRSSLSIATSRHLTSYWTRTTRQSSQTLGSLRMGRRVTTLMSRLVSWASARVYPNWSSNGKE